MDDIGMLAGLRDFPLARRGFFMSGLISGLTLATTRVEAQAINTDSAGIEAMEVKIPVPDGEIPGYAARPQGAGPFPIVLVNEEVFGVHEYIGDVVRRLAKEGYLAVAPEVFARIADMGKVQASELRGVLAKLSDASVNTDLDAALQWASANRGDPARVAVMGFCRGGRAAWMHAAHNPAVKAAVAFYGSVASPHTANQPRNPTDVAGDLHAPLLGLYGGKDQNIKVDDVQAAAAKARAAGKTVEIVVYPDAPHGFHADYRPSYREADAKDAWARMLAWFRKYGV